MFSSNKVNMNSRNEMDLPEFYDYIKNDELSQVIKYTTVLKNNDVILYSAQYIEFININVYKKDIISDKYVDLDDDFINEYMFDLTQDELLKELSIELRTTKLTKLKENIWGLK